MFRQSSRSGATPCDEMTDAPVFLACYRTLAIIGGSGVVNQKPKDQKVVSAASTLAKIRWEGLSADERREAMAPAIARSAKVRKSQPRAIRAARAAKAAKSISPEAAKARALKAWETKRRKAESAKAG